MVAPLTPEDFESLLPGYSDQYIQTAIDDAWAIAVSFVPGLNDPDVLSDEGKVSTIKAVMKRAITYDVTSQGQTVKSESVGAYSHTFSTSSVSPTLFSESQIDALRRVVGGAVTADVVRGVSSMRMRSGVSSYGGYDRFFVTEKRLGVGRIM